VEIAGNSNSGAFLHILDNYVKMKVYVSDVMEKGRPATAGFRQDRLSLALNSSEFAENADHASQLANQVEEFY